MELTLPTGETLNLDFEPLTTLARDPAYHTREIIDQLNSGAFREIAMRADGKITLDLGANIGLFSIYLASVAKRVVAFEPSPEHYRVLRKVLKYTGQIHVNPIPAAIGPHREHRTFYKNANRTADSFYPIGQVEAFEVQSVTLAEAIAECREPPALVKCDIEGAEVEVLRDPEFLTVVAGVGAFYLECHNFKEWCGGEAVVAEMAAILRRAFPHVDQTGTNSLFAYRD